MSFEGSSLGSSQSKPSKWPCCSSHTATARVGLVPKLPYEDDWPWITRRCVSDGGYIILGHIHSRGNMICVIRHGMPQVLVPCYHHPEAFCHCCPSQPRVFEQILFRYGSNTCFRYADRIQVFMLRMTRPSYTKLIWQNYYNLYHSPKGYFPRHQKQGGILRFKAKAMVAMVSMFITKHQTIRQVFVLGMYCCSQRSSMLVITAHL